MKLLRNKFVIGILCITIGLLIGFVALPKLQQSIPTINAVRMKESVDAGTRITADMIETVRVQENMVEGNCRDTVSVVGKYAKTALYVRDYLTPEKLSVTLEQKNVLAAGTEKGKMVVSLTLPSLASGVSGRLLPGDVVTVMALPKTNSQTLGLDPTRPMDKTKTPVTIYPELQYVEVCMVTTNEGEDADVQADTVDQPNSLPVTVSFYVNQEQALRLAELEQESAIYLAFVARGKDTAQYIPDVQRVLNVQEVS